jgi:predicted nuclease with TOPRIM domain
MKVRKSYLPFNLQYFAEEQSNENVTPSDETKNAVPNDVSDKSTAPAQEHMIPKSRFDEVNQNFKEMKAQLDAILAEKAEQERKVQEEQGQFQELYKSASDQLNEFKTKTEQFETRAKELEGVIGQLLEAKLSDIPEEFHDIIPDNLGAEQKLAWIERAQTKGLFGAKAQSPIGESTNPGNSQAIDLSKLNPLQLLKAGYGKK